MTRPGGSFQRLPYTLWVLFGAILLSFLAGSALFYRSQERHLQEDERQKLLAVAQLKVNEITSWRRERLGDGAVAVSGPFLSAAIARWMQTSDPALAAQITERLEAYRRNYHYAAAFIADIDGQVRLSSGTEEERVSPETARFLQTAIREQRPLFSDFYICSIHHAAHLDIIAPITVEEKKEFGALILRIDPNEFLYPLIQSWPTPSTSAETLIVRHDGDDALFLNDLRHQKGTALKLRIPLTRTDVPAVMAIQGKEGIVEGIDYRGVPVLSALKQIPDSSWYMVAKIDIAEAFSAWRFRATAIIIGTLLLLGLAFAGIGFFWYRQQGHHYRALYLSEKERKESEALLKTLIDTIPDMIWLKNPEGVYVACNRRFELFFGTKEPEIVGKSDYDFVDREVADFFRRHDLAAMSAGKPTMNEELVTFANDGHQEMLETIKTPIYGETGTLIGVLGIGRDITARKRAEKEIRLNEARLRESQRVAHVGSWEFDLESEKIWGSDEGFRIYGLPIPEDNELPIDRIEVCIPERERVHRALVDLIEKNIPYRLEFAINPADGSDQKIITSDAELIRDDKGVPLKVAGVIQDVTKRKRAEKTLRLSEEKFYKAFHASPDTLIITRTTDGRIVEVNEEFSRMSGYTKEEALNSSTIALSLWADPVERDRVVTALRETGGVRDREVAFRVKDGHLIDCLYAGEIIQLYGEAHVLSIVRDITDRKRAVAALQESEEKYRLLVDTANEAILVAQDGYLKFFNRKTAKLLGDYSNEELMTLPFPTFIHPEDRELVTANYLRRIKGEMSDDRYTFRVMNRDGAVKWVEIGAVTIEWEGRPATLNFLSEVTDRKVLESARDELMTSLQNKNEEMESILYASSHDLRTPLVNIQGFSARIRRYLGELDRILAMKASSEEMCAAAAPIIQENIPKALGFVTASTNKMDALINGLLKLSRLGRTAHAPEMIDMNDLLHETLDALKFQTQETAATITVDNLPPCWGDRHEIGQAFSNLIDNALKYRDPDRPLAIRVSGTAMGSRVAYSVEDTGIGIKKGHQDQIWGLFSRLDPGGPVPGEGIGLAVVKRIIQRNRGKIWLESERGKGSSFYIVLPCDRAAAGKTDTAMTRT